MKNSHRAFTLIEVVVATALSACLLIAVLAVIGKLAHQQEYAVQKQGIQDAQVPLQSLLEMDFLNARSVAADPAGIRLSGFGGLAFGTNQVSQLPCDVVYAVKKTSTTSWLVRDQKTTSPGCPAQERTDLVLEGVQNIAVSGGLEASGPAGRSGSGSGSDKATVVLTLSEKDSQGQAKTLAMTLYLR